jgi:hypothetical protein
MEPFPANSEFIDKNQEKLVALRLLAEHSLLSPENRLTITTDESLNMEFNGDVPEGPAAKKTFDLPHGEISEEERHAIIEIDRKAQMGVAYQSICALVARVAMHEVATSINGGTAVDETAWPPLGFENINYYKKSNPDGMTISFIEIKDIRGVGDAAEMTIEIEDGVITKSLHLLSIGNQIVKAINLVNPTNDEQLRGWFSNMNEHTDEITEILTSGFRTPIDELEPKIDDLSDRLLDEGYSPDYVSQVTKELYDRIIAMKSQIEMQTHTDIITPDQEDLAYFEKKLNKTK